MFSVSNDLRYALRQMRRAPVLTITIILTLGLGIGATTAIFSLIHAVMLKSLPVADPQSLYHIGTGKICCYTAGLQGEWDIFSYDLYQRIRKSTPQFEQIAAFQAQPNILSVRQGAHTAQAQALFGEYVSGNYFQTLGVAPFAGRLFTDADDRRGAPPVAVMSYHTWQQDYASNLSIIGTTFAIEGFSFTLVGVTPPGFYGETLSNAPPGLWVPLQTEFLTDAEASYNLVPSNGWLRLIGRLRPGASLAGVSDQLTAQLQHWLLSDSAMLSNNQVELKQKLAQQRISIEKADTGIDDMRQEYGKSLGVLLSICGLVLLIACANGANLLLARGLGRRPQTAVMSALGASRGRLVQQALTESILLAVLGAICGVLIALAGSRMLVGLAFGHSSDNPVRAGLSWPMLGFGLLLALVSGVLFGTLPAILLARTNPVEALRGMNRSARDTSAPLRRTLIVLQTGVSVGLLAAATLLTRSMLNIQHQDFGFALDHRISVRLEPPLAAYSLDHLNLLYRQLQEGLEALPGVHSASVALFSPLTGVARESVVLPGEGPPPADNSRKVLWDRVSPRYFETMGQQLLEGRVFTTADDDHTRGVAIVNQAFVRRYFPHQDALGKVFGFAPANSSALQIVGVVRDAKYEKPEQPAGPMVFAPLAQHILYTDPTLQDNEKWSHFTTSIQVWANGDLATLDPRIREVFRKVDPNFAITAVQTMRQQVDLNFDQQRLLARLSSLFGLVALLLASIGLYGVTAYNVVRRTGEIGVRMAIGATRWHIAAMVLRGALLQIAAGFALGFFLALLFGRLLATQLYEVGSLDPAALLLPGVALLLCALIASGLPARRAASIEPLAALRAE